MLPILLCGKAKTISHSNWVTANLMDCDQISGGLAIGWQPPFQKRAIELSILDAGKPGCCYLNVSSQFLETLQE